MSGREMPMQASRCCSAVCRADAGNGWCTSAYIFPDGYCATTRFRSSADPSGAVIHECSIVGRGGRYWPRPTFVVVAADRPNEPLVAKSCSGAWKQVCAPAPRTVCALAVRCGGGGGGGGLP